MGPAIRVRGSGGLVATKTLAAAGQIEPDGVPSRTVTAIQNNRVAHGITEGAATARLREPGKRSAAVFGDRCCGSVCRCKRRRSAEGYPGYPR